MAGIYNGSKSGSTTLVITLDNLFSAPNCLASLEAFLPIPTLLPLRGDLAKVRRGPSKIARKESHGELRLDIWICGLRGCCYWKNE